MALPKDQFELRKQRSIAIGQVYTRTYRVPIGSADTDIPARGDVVALNDVTPTTGLLAPRVLNNPRRLEHQKTGMIEVVIDFIAVEAYTSGETTAPLEVKSSRREWSSADHSYGERLFVASAEADLPNTGKFFTNSAGTNEASLKLRGRKCVDRRIDDQAVPGLYLATLTYLAFKPFGTGGSAADRVEIRPRRGPRLTGLNNWEGQRTWLATYAAAKAISATVWGENFPDMSGTYTPQALSTPRFEYDPEGWTDAVRITVRYATPRVRIYAPPEPQRGKARLTLSGSYTYKLPPNLTRELSGEQRIIKGADPDGKHWWQPIVAAGPYPIICLQTAAYRVNVAETLGYIGFMNSGSHTHIMNSTAKMLLMLNVTMAHTHDDAVVALNFYMARNPDGWDKVVKSQKGQWIIAKKDVYELSGNDWVITGDLAPRKILQFVPAMETVNDKLVATEPEDRNVIKAKDFSLLSGLVVW